MSEYPTTPNFADSFERVSTKVVENAAEGSAKLLPLHAPTTF